MFKWILCSDYCLDDKNKANRVITFVLFPYIFDFNQWQELIGAMQKTDLKHTRSISSEFCNFLNQGLVFSFSFILKQHCIFDTWKDKNTMEQLINEYIRMTEQWQTTTPSNADTYKQMNQRLKKLSENSRAKSFNYGLLARIITVTFLAGYLKYLLFRECSDVKLYSWLSDIDNITTWQDGIYYDIYRILSHCLCINKLPEYEKVQPEELYAQISDNHIFYEQLNRVADFICGGIADFNYSDGSVTAKKHCTIMEDIISDNPNIILINVNETGISRVVHNKI